MSNIAQFFKIEGFYEIGRIVVFRSVGVHSGHFHADEVTACALLIFYDLVDRNQIVRSRDSLVLDQCEYVCDVGGLYDPALKRFDHHQVSYQGEMSSAGMILLYLLQETLIDQKEYDFFNQHLIKGIDDHDNGRFLDKDYVCTFSHVIASFNPCDYQASSEQCDRGFEKALDFCLQYLHRLKERFEYEQECAKIVKKVMDDSTVCLMFDQPMVWLEPFFALGGEKHPALFVIMPSDHQWKLRGVPPTLEEKNRVRLPLSEKWAGLIQKDLAKASGIQGAVFCHKGRFISVWETKEDAIKALKKVLKEAGVNHEDYF